MKRSVQWMVGLLWAAGVALPAAVAQGGGGLAAATLMGDDAGIVKRLPLEAVEAIEETTPLVDGTQITHRFEERKWRDSEGRFRKESAAVTAGREPVFSRATIVDPVKNTLTILDLDTKTAVVTHLREGQLHPYVDLGDKDIMAQPGVKVKVEKLEGKQIAGVYAVGRRVTRTRPPGTVGNDKTLVSVSERWVSPDLKILLATSMLDPREVQTRAVTKLGRDEPDAALFQVPSDFTVKEAVARSPGR